MSPSPEELQKLRVRLETDDRFYIRKLLKIIDQRERTVSLEPKPAQERLLAVKARQEAEGKPVRIIVLKARREGISTIVQALMIKRITQRRNHKALVIAHDKKTASEIFGMGETMYAELPGKEVIAGLPLKPPISSTARGQEIRLGEPSRHRRLEGHRGLNSSYLVDTANEYEAGRGFTYNSLHLSEFGFWQQQGKKLRAILSTLPDEPESMCVIESTANAYNLFRELWVAAMNGNSDYFPLFISWYEDPDYTRPFANAEAREEFIAGIGLGPYGEAEPDLVEAECTPEQLNWRRWAIQNRSHGDLRAFMQEFPATWEEAFLSSGRQVFAPNLTAKIVQRTAETPPRRGLIHAKSLDEVNYRGDRIQRPTAVEWVDDERAGEHGAGIATPRWEIWRPPFPGMREIADDSGHVEVQMRPPGQYVISCDSASGIETESAGTDYFAIQVIDHHTREQCARFHHRSIDADLVALELYKAALWYGPEFMPWVVIELTGGYGVSIANRLLRVYRYPLLYRRSPADVKGEKQENRIGWSTDVRTKPLIVDHARELFRTENDGLRDRETAAEAQTYVRDEKGRMGAENNYFDDLLEAWMVGQYVAHEKPPRRSRWEQPKEERGPSGPAPTLRRRRR